jgi:hypothetical protein
MTPPARLLPLLLTAALLVLAGCGGSGSESATSILDKTFGSNASVKSGKLTLALDANVSGIGTVKGPISARLSGPFQSAGTAGLPKFDFDATLKLGGQTINAGAVSTSDKGWLKFMGTTYAVPDALFAQFRSSYLQSQKQSASKKQQSSLQKLGIDPRRWLTDPKTVGDKQVAGADTVHITSGIDVPKLLDDVQKTLHTAGTAAGSTTKQLTQADRDAIQKSVKSAKVDVYSGKGDDRLHKLVLNLQLTSGTVVFTLQLDDLDKDQTIAAPKGAKPLSDLVAQFQGAGAPAPSASGGTGGSTATTPGAAPSQKYLQCIQSAGKDLAKVQGCAKYL